MNGIVEFSQVGFGYDESPVFSSLTLSVPPGVTSLVGPNGVGKSTFLLLASGRILPQSGSVALIGKDTRQLDEPTRAELASLVFQNMEFETDEPLGSLLEYVFTQGRLGAAEHDLVKTVVVELELESLLARKTQTLSKGEMQRAVMAFSLLFGSRAVMMDEPVFALEDGQKKRALGFLSEQARSRGLSFLYSAHELDLSRAFSDQVLLFSKGGKIALGSADELLTRPHLEEAYQVPFVLLHQKERLYRSTLLQRPGPTEAQREEKEKGHPEGGLD